MTDGNSGYCHLSDNSNDKNMFMWLNFQVELDWPVIAHYTYEIEENN